MTVQDINVEPNVEPNVEWVGETSLMLTLGHEIIVTLAPVIGRISRRIQSECSGIREVTPSYTTILIEADTTCLDIDQLGDKILKIARDERDSSRDSDSDDEVGRSGKFIELPVYYHSEVGPDLKAVAEYGQMTTDQVVAIHSGKEYTVCSIGFAPGFAFLADVDERIATPRHERPRSKVVRGSVGIAGRQTAVYPADTPGGWQIIGNCPLPLFDPEGNAPFKVGVSIFEVGDRVRFIPIDRETFLQQGGNV